MVSSGYKQSIYYGRESTYGDEATINRDFGLVQSASPTEKNNLIKVRTMGGNRDYYTVIPGKFEVGGNVEYYLQDCRFLKYAWGEDTASTANIDSGPKVLDNGIYMHLMGSADSPSAGNFPSFTVELTDDEDTTANKFKRIFTGAMVDKLSLSAEIDNPVTVSADWIAQSVRATTASESSITAQTEDPYVFYQGQLYMTSGNIRGSVSIDSDSKLCQLNSFTFNINNNLEPTWYISGTCNSYQTLRGLKSLIPKGRDYDASIGLNFDTFEQYRRFLGSVSNRGNDIKPQGDLSKFQIALDFVRGGNGMGAQSVDSATDMMRIVLSSALFEDVSINGSPEDIVSEDYTIFPRSARVYVWDDISGSYA